MLISTRTAVSLVVTVGAWFLAVNPAPGQEEETAGLRAEVAALRQLVEQQSRQLEQLTAHVGRLTQLIERGQPAPDPSATATPPIAPIQDMPPATAPGSPAPAPIPVATPQPHEPADSPAPGSSHTITRGETLTSIARKYGVTIEELQEINNIQDERKLQIGQTLLIPQPTNSEATPNPETFH